MALKLLNKMPEIIRYAKQQTNFWRDLPWALTVGHARDWLAVHADSDEVEEGLRAFYEKREVDYEGLREGASASGVRCGSCGALMPGGYKFCGQCGSELKEAPRG
jgi:naphthoate synthase